MQLKLPYFDTSIKNVGDTTTFFVIRDRELVEIGKAKRTGWWLGDRIAVQGSTEYCAYGGVRKIEEK